MNKKVIISLVIAIIVIVAGIGLFAMYSNNSEKTGNVDNNTNAELALTEENNTSSEVVTDGENNTLENTVVEAENTSSDEKKVLIAYFSETGNTEKFANIIHEQIGGDLFKIESVKTYPTEYQDLADEAKKEQDNDERPEIKGTIDNLDDYDTIFIGYPIWWYDVPMIMYTFFDTYDFSGKTIIPFNTHEGSGEGGTYKEIQDKFEPNATVLEGLPIRGGNMEKDQTDIISNWLKELGF